MHPALSTLRLLHVIPTLGIGGAERMVTSLARYQHEKGHAVAVASMYPPLGTWLEEDLEAGGVELRFLDKHRGLDLRMVARLGRTISRFRPQIVHTHMYTLKYALPFLLARRCPAVHTVHTLASWETDPMSRVVHQLAFKAGVSPVAIGNAVAASIRDRYRVAPRRIIPNGIPVSDFAPPPGAREEVRTSLSIPAQAPVFLTVGRLSPQKNHAALIDAFAADRLRSTGAHLLLAGSGELRAEIEQRVKTAGLTSSVRLLGLRKDVPRLLAAADVFVLSSWVEGNPLSVMEAMASGKPVIASAVGSLPDIVSASCGELVPAGDTRALESAMYALASDMALARKKGGASQRVARERFDVSVMGDAYELLYRELL